MCRYTYRSCAYNKNHNLALFGSNISLPTCYTLFFNLMLHTMWWCCRQGRCWDFWAECWERPCTRAFSWIYPLPDSSSKSFALATVTCVPSPEYKFLLMLILQPPTHISIHSSSSWFTWVLFVWGRSHYRLFIICMDKVLEGWDWQILLAKIVLFFVQFASFLPKLEWIYLEHGFLIVVAAWEGRISEKYNWVIKIRIRYLALRACKT